MIILKFNIMKKIYFIFIILSAIFSSCKELNEVRILPELNFDEKNIELNGIKDASYTSSFYTTESNVYSEFEADWLSVEITKTSVIFTALSDNETGEPRSTDVKIIAGEFTKDVTVTQIYGDKTTDNSLKVGQLTEDGLGMIFWVDPNDNTIGKAISLQRWGGNPFEANIKAHNALSTFNGFLNTSLFEETSENDAVALCKSLGDGWYLPASDELIELFKAYNGVSEGEPGFTNDVPANISDTEKQSRNNFEKLLTDLEGSAINMAGETASGDSYWSSTESEDGEKARWIRFGKYANDYGAKSSTARFVRAMKVVGNYKFPDEPTEEPASIEVSTNTLTLTKDASSEGNITVESNKPFSATQDEASKSWLEMIVSENSLNFKTLSANSENDSRTAKITLTAGEGENITSVELTIIQKGNGINIGDIYEDNGRKGVIFWISQDGKSAKIMSIKRTETPINWASSSENATALGLNDNSDGEINTQKMKESGKTSTELPILAGCENGWYIPAKDELQEIYRLYDSSRETFETILENNGGDKMNSQPDGSNGDSYFTSTENPSNGTQVYYIRFGKHTISPGAKYSQSPARYARYIKKISIN